MSVLSRRLRETRRRLRLKQGELAEKLGVTQGTISRWENGGQSPDMSAMMKLAEIAGIADTVRFALDDEEHPFRTSDWGLQVHVIGRIAEDLWLEDPEWDESQRFQVQIPTLPKWEEYRIEGFLVGDYNTDPVYPKESIVFIANLYKAKVELMHDDVVVVERSDNRGLYEMTLRKVFITAKREMYLILLSEDPSAGKNFKVVETGELPGEDAPDLTCVTLDSIRGLVLASFRIDDQRRDKSPYE
jgi:transcriptional regulator with XRE-family HTH domain